MIRDLLCKRYRQKILEQIVTVGDLKKQPPEVHCRKRCSQNFHKFHRKTPELESFFNKLAELRASNFIRNKFQCSCFPVEFAKLLRTPIFKNICGRLLLYLHVILFSMHEKDIANNP